MSSFSEIVKKIDESQKKDKATDAEIFLYLGEELGEIAACLATSSGLKNKKLKETAAQECCDLIICAIALIKRTSKFTDQDILDYIDKKHCKWEKRVS